MLHKVHADPFRDSAVRVAPFQIGVAALLTMKFVVDGFYEYEAVRVAYLALLLLLSLCLVFVVRGFNSLNTRGRGNIFSLFVVVVLYSLAMIAVNGISISVVVEISKVVSPFVLYLLLVRRVSCGLVRWFGVGSLICLLALVASMPFSFSWKLWGQANTFVGWYFFKTDAAYAAVFSFLIVSIWRGRRVDWCLALAFLCAAAVVVAGNSRLNYVTFGLVCSYILIGVGVGFWSMLKICLIACFATLCGWYLYDGSNALSLFDYADIGAFSQGRSEIWGVLVDHGLSGFSITDWIWGRGLGADVDLSVRYGENGALAAHNEVLYLLLTQGFVGLLLYFLAWLFVYLDFLGRDCRPYVGWGFVLALCLLLIQSLTANVSGFTTKTWPVIYVAVLIVAASRERKKYLMADRAWRRDRMACYE